MVEKHFKIGLRLGIGNWKNIVIGLRHTKRYFGKR